MIATTIRKVIMESSSAIANSLVHRCHFEHGHGQMNPSYDQAFREFRTNPGRNEFANHLSVFANAALAKHKNILHGDDFALHARNFRDADDLASSVAKAAYLNYQIDR